MRRGYERLLNHRLGNHRDKKNNGSDRRWIPGRKVKVGGRAICWGGTFPTGTKCCGNEKVWFVRSRVADGKKMKECGMVEKRGKDRSFWVAIKL